MALPCAAPKVVYDLPHCGLQGHSSADLPQSETH